MMSIFSKHLAYQYLTDFSKQFFPRPTHKGRVGFSLLANWAEPNNPHIQADYTARDNWLIDTIGWFAGPITSGDYPTSIRERYGSLVPEFTAIESNSLMNSVDFFAIDHYTTYLVSTTRVNLQ